MRARRTVLVGAAGLLGAAIGWAAASHELRRHRGALFHPSPFRRLVALGTLEHHATLDTLHVLRDYLRWERHPRLRRRGTRLLRRLETTLG